MKQTKRNGKRCTGKWRGKLIGRQAKGWWVGEKEGKWIDKFRWCQARRLVSKKGEWKSVSASVDRERFQNSNSLPSQTCTKQTIDFCKREGLIGGNSPYLAFCWSAGRQSRYWLHCVATSVAPSLIHGEALEQPRHCDYRRPNIGS